MDSPQKKLGSTMDGKTPHHLPVTVSVSAWALFNAIFFLCSYALGSAIVYALHRYHVRCSQSSFFLRCSLLTDAEAAVENTLFFLMLCCAVPQAAAAMLSLRLPCGRRQVRRVLAYLAFTLTIIRHLMVAADFLLNLAADPGDLFYGIVFTVLILFYMAGDIICFLALLRGSEEQD